MTPEAALLAAAAALAGAGMVDIVAGVRVGRVARSEGG
jgi:hypothetical protein